MSRVETIGNATLYLGDCREILPTLPKVDAVITDPPYGIGISLNPFRQMHDVMDWDTLPPDRKLLIECIEKSDASIIWGGNYFNLPPSQGFFIWDKVQPEDFSSAMVEYAWSSIQKPAKMFHRHVVSYEKFHPTTKPVELMEWCIKQISGKEPEKWPSPWTMIVLDPFMGSGTTGVACMNLGRRFIGVEIETKYFDIACRRIEDAQRQQRLLP